MMSIRSIRRVFSDLPQEPLASNIQQNYYSKIEYYKPILAQENVPGHFKFFSYLSLFPLVSSGLLLAICPHFGLLSAVMPQIATYSCIYAALHSTFLSGVHIGLASVFYDPTLTNKDGQQIKKQLIYPLVVPIFSWIICMFMFVFPVSNIKFLTNLTGIGLIYTSTLAADMLYTTKQKTVPVWYKNWKVYTTLVSTGSLALIIFGLYNFPELIQKNEKTEVQSILELLQDDTA